MQVTLGLRDWILCLISLCIKISRVRGQNSRSGGNDIDAFEVDRDEVSAVKVNSLLIRNLNRKRYLRNDGQNISVQKMMASFIVEQNRRAGSKIDY